MTEAFTNGPTDTHHWFSSKIQRQLSGERTILLTNDAGAHGRTERRALPGKGAPGQWEALSVGKSLCSQDGAFGITCPGPSTVHTLLQARASSASDRPVSTGIQRSSSPGPPHPTLPGSPAFPGCSQTLRLRRPRHAIVSCQFHSIITQRSPLPETRPDPGELKAPPPPAPAPPPGSPDSPNLRSGATSHSLPGHVAVPHVCGRNAGTHQLNAPPGTAPPLPSPIVLSLELLPPPTCHACIRLLVYRLVFNHHHLLHHLSAL